MAAPVIARDKPPVFDGAPTSDLTRYLRRVTAYCAATNVEDNAICNIVELGLQGIAATWYENQIKNNTNGINRWVGAAGQPTLRTLLEARFQSRISAGQVNELTRSTKQKLNETVSDFMDRCERVRFDIENDVPQETKNEAAYGIMHRKAVAELFLNGLHDNIQTATLNQCGDGADLPAILAAAKRAEGTVQDQSINLLMQEDEVTQDYAEAIYGGNIGQFRRQQNPRNLRGFSAFYRGRGRFLRTQRGSRGRPGFRLSRGTPSTRVRHNGLCLRCDRPGHTAWYCPTLVNPPITRRIAEINLSSDQPEDSQDEWNYYYEDEQDQDQYFNADPPALPDTSESHQDPVVTFPEDTGF